MIKKVIVSDVMDRFIKSIDFTQTVLSHSNAGADTTIFVSDVYHSFKKGTCKIDGSDYVIKSVNYVKNSVVVIGVIVTPLIYDVGTPIFIHGISTMVTKRVNKLASEKKTPFIYLLGNDNGYNVNNVRKTYNHFENIDIFFVADNGRTPNGTDEADYHIDDISQPLRNLKTKFCNELNKYKMFGVEYMNKQFNHRYRVFFGDVYKGTGKNTDKSVFDARLDALQLSFELPIDTDYCSN